MQPQVSDDDAADVLANGHPKSNPPPTHDAQVLPGGPGAGAAPGASGPPTTGRNRTRRPAGLDLTVVTSSGIHAAHETYLAKSC